jgi:hypothetical protein
VYWFRGKILKAKAWAKSGPQRLFTLSLARNGHQNQLPLSRQLSQAGDDWLTL